MQDLLALKTAIAAESHRPNLAAEYGDYIRRAEQRIGRSVRCVEMITSFTLSDAHRVSSESSEYYLPTGFLEDILVLNGDPDIPADIQHGNQKPLADKLTLHDLYKVSLNSPVNYYGVYSREQQIGDIDRGPIISFRGMPPLSEGPPPFSFLKVYYFSRPNTLVNDFDKNNILVNHEILYLSASLFELYRVTQDLELAQAQLDIFENATKTVNEQAGRFLGGTRLFGRRSTIGRTVGNTY